MGIFKTLSDNVVEIGVMSVSIILISLLLINMKNQNISSSICPGASNATHTWYNSTGDICCIASGNCVTPNQSVISALGTSINTSVTGVGIPITYISIIVLVVVFSAILVMLITKLRNKT